MGTAFDCGRLANGGSVGRRGHRAAHWCAEHRPRALATRPAHATTTPAAQTAPRATLTDPIAAASPPDADAGDALTPGLQDVSLASPSPVAAAAATSSADDAAMFASIESPDASTAEPVVAAAPPAAAAPQEEAQEESGWGGWSLMSAVSKATYKIGDVAAGVTAYAKETAVSVASSAAETSTGTYVTETLSGVKAKVAEKIEQVDVESIKTKAKESYADFRQDPKASTIAAASVAKSAVAQTASAAAGAAVQVGGRAYESAKDIAENSQTVAAVASVGGRALEGASRGLVTIGISETLAMGGARGQCHDLHARRHPPPSHLPSVA